MNNNIEINLNEYKDVTDKFDSNKLCNELACFIYNQYMALPIKVKPEIIIKTNQPLTGEQETSIVDMIHKHFGLEVQKSIISFRYKIKYQMLLFLIGVLLIAISNLNFIVALSTFHELLLIIGWVAVWELIYDGLFVDFKENVKRKRYKKLSNAKVNFIK